MQILLLDELPPEGLSFDGAVDPGELRDDRDRVLPVSDVRAALRVRRGERGIVLSGSVGGHVELECVRCLCPYSLTIDADVELIVVDGMDVPTDGEVHLTAADALLFEVADRRLDLGRVVREQLYLALPLKPMCRPDCRGLCQTCGADRNGIECGCSRERPDERWGPLIGLRQRLADKGERG